MPSPATRKILDRIGTLPPRAPLDTPPAQPPATKTASTAQAHPAPSPRGNQTRSKLARGAQTKSLPSAAGQAFGVAAVPETKPAPAPAKGRPIEAAVKTEPSSEPRSKPKETRKRFQEPDARRIEARIATLTLMRERWPMAFNIDHPLPLAIGADKMVRAELDADDTSITDAFRWWTSHPVYLQALAAGGPRYGLDGCPSGEVTEENRQHARGRRAQRHVPAQPEPAGLDNVEPT